jgi:hypothetical protein
MTGKLLAGITGVMGYPAILGTCRCTVYHSKDLM